MIDASPLLFPDMIRETGNNSSGRPFFIHQAIQINPQEVSHEGKDMEKRQGKRGGERPTREEMLERFDTDGDGQLSEEERVAMREAFEARRRAHEEKAE